MKLPDMMKLLHMLAMASCSRWPGGQRLDVVRIVAHCMKH